MSALPDLHLLSIPIQGAEATPPGLTSAEVEARRRQGLTNAVQLKTSRTVRDIILTNLFSPINLVLYVIGASMILVHDLSIGGAGGTLGLALLNSLVTIVQEVSAKRQLDAIALLKRARVKVVRDGREQTIDPDDLVLDDVLAVGAGDQIPVDGELLAGSKIEADESALTGESDLVAKSGGDKVLSGSVCVTGSGFVRATAVGESSFANQLTRSARQFKMESTPLQHDVDRLLRLLLLIVFHLMLLAVLTLLVADVSRPLWLRALSVIVGIYSVGLLTLIALNYSWSAIRIAQKGALVQQINAVEALSHVTVLCSDKTGTLTTNRIQYRQTYPVGIERSVLESLLGDFAASAASPNKTAQALIDGLHGTPRKVIDEVPFASARKWSALVFDDPPLQGAYVLGAAEVLRGAMEWGEEAQRQIETWSDEGLRVLVFGRNPEAMTLHGPDGETHLPRLALVGVVCFGDELRPHLRETLAAFRGNGVQVKIISGDSPRTVAALARQAGFEGELKTVSGPELAAMSPEELARAAAEATIFGRIVPQQKEALVEALQQQGQYVAMIGDGVNDVLSLKRADVGIAMQSGSTAAQAVAAMVLRNDSFEAMPLALTEGQRTVSSVHSILKLYFVSMLALVPLILGTATLGLGFPYTTLESQLVSFFARGAPPVVVSATARPAQHRESLWPGFLRFALPGSLVMFVFGLLLFVGTYLTVQHDLLEVRVTPQMIVDLGQRTHELYIVTSSADYVKTLSMLAAQTTLTAFLCLSGILLMLFAAPPARWFAVVEPEAETPLAALAAVGLILAFTGVMLIPPVSQFFELVPLPPVAYEAVGLVTVAWMLVQREVWRGRWLERFLDVDLTGPNRRSNAPPASR